MIAGQSVSSVGVNIGDTENNRDELFLFAERID